MQQYAELASELDLEAWEWLDLQHPTLADALRREVERGATPEGLRSFIVRHSGINRLDLARRCEGAARHLEAQRK